MASALLFRSSLFHSPLIPHLTSLFLSPHQTVSSPLLDRRVYAFHKKFDRYRHLSLSLRGRRRPLQIERVELNTSRWQRKSEKHTHCEKSDNTVDWNDPVCKLQQSECNSNLSLDRLLRSTRSPLSEITRGDFYFYFLFKQENKGEWYEFATVMQASPSCEWRSLKLANNSEKL